MEPHEAPSIERTPQPKPEKSEDGSQAPVEQAPATQERLKPSIDSSSQGGPPSSSLPLPQSPAVVVPAGTPVKDDSAATQTTGPAIADDVDVIEREWVDKAKSIVDHHKHDPYNQEKEASKLQADYLKKRYGKDIKLAE